MNLQDLHRYLLPIERDDWDQLLAEWTELIPNGSSKWLLSRFGELFLEQTDGKIGMLQITGFQYQVVADNKQDFEEWLDDPDKMIEWFFAPLVDLLTSSGKTLEPDHCYSFITPLGLGGQIRDDNIMVIPVKENFKCWGEVFRQIKDLPDCSQVVLKVK